MATLRSPSSPAKSSASSPSTKTGVDRRKCTPTIGASTLTVRTRSASEGIGICVSLTLGDAAFKALTNSVLGKITADEDDAAVALFIRAPRPLMVAVENHVHALEPEALGIILEQKNSLAPQNARTILRDQILKPRKELVGIERLVCPQRDRLHLFIVVVLQPVAVVMVVMIVTMVVIMVMVVLVVMNIGLEERRLNLENAIEIEGIPDADFSNIDLGALRAVQPRIRIESTNSCLECAQLFRGYQVGLVDQDDIGKGDLVLCFRRVFEAIHEQLAVGNGDSRIQFGPRTTRLVHEECLRDRRGVREAGGFHDNRVEFPLAPHQAIDDPHEVAAHGATDAPIIHLEHFFVGIDDQLVVDADL